MELSIFRFFWLFLFIGEYEQLPAATSTCSCFGDGSTSLNYELISSPPDVPWQINDNQRLVDNYPYESRSGGQTIPQDYHLTITPDFKSGTFEGRVVIVIEAVKKTKTIKLNSEKLDIKEVTIKGGTVPEKNLERTTFKLDIEKNFLIIKLSESLLVSKRYNIVIEFSGHLYQNNPFGFAMYGTKFTTTSKDAYVAETLFDPFFARKAFPCFDELHYRTPFSVEIALDENENAVSNARLKRAEPVDEESRGEKRKITFRKLRAAPINTIYYAILNEEYVYKSTRGRYFVWTVNEFIGQVSYALLDLEYITDAIESLTNFHSGYLGRIDLVVPIQKEIQPGFLSFIKKNLLCDPGYCSEKHQEQVTKSIIHHVSNRLFGQEVSIRSWNYFWLRDGFRTFYGFYLTHMIKPNWRMSEFHGSVVMQSILCDDRRFFFHPLTRSHKLSKKEIFETQHSERHFEFYNGKASLIIRMLEHIVGRSTFDKAIRTFLRYTSLDGLVTPDDLWDAFMRKIREEHVDLKLPDSKTLADVMTPFTTQVGYPLVIVSETVDRKIIIDQVPYVSIRKNSLIARLQARNRVVGNQSWIVPITITTQTKPNLNTKPVAWSMPNSKLTLDTTLNESEWYILNVKNTGYYRVNYSLDNWMKLVEQLKEDRLKIHPLNRAQLIVDSHVLAVDMKLEIKIPIEMTTYLTNEDDPLVWMVALNQFKRFYMALSEGLRPAYKKFFVGYLKNEYRRIGFKTSRHESHADKIWKSELLKFLCWIGDQECITEAEKMYTDNDNPANIDPNHQHVVFCTMLQRRDPVPVMASLEEMVLTNNNLCLRDVVRNVSACGYAPVGNENLTRIKLKPLLNRAITGDPTAENIMNDILSNFDTLLPLLKVIKDHITQISATGQDIEQNLDGLANFVRILKGRQFGLAEFNVFIDLYSAVRELEKTFKNKYTSLGMALLKIYADFKGGIEDLHTKERLLSNILQTTKSNAIMPETLLNTSRGSVSVLPPLSSNSNVDISAGIRNMYDIVNESETSMATPPTDGFVFVLPPASPNETIDVSASEPDVISISKNRFKSE